MREAEDKFRSAFESAAVGMAMYGVDGQFLQVNRALSDILGCPASQILKLNFESLTHPQDLLIDEPLRHDMLEGVRTNYQIEKRLIHHQGHVIWVVMSVSAVWNAKGQILYFLAQIQDITERKKTKQRLLSASIFYAP
ncbi:MAG: PAS domain S-box protein [Limnobacter sp.]|nr:PAS domain S-box protein [Limnobacter sp.]